jgi:hypothetical protein
LPKGAYRTTPLKQKPTTTCNPKVTDAIFKEAIMSMYATIYSTEMEPLTDGSDFNEGDNSVFEALETQAAELAAAGQKCCIRWSRESDAQVAYWGPAGATLKPHWYAKPGRPEEMQGGKRRNVYLDDASWAKAVEIGNGNASDGIRMALALESKALSP